MELEGKSNERGFKKIKSLNARGYKFGCG